LLQGPNNLFIDYLSSKLLFTVIHWLIVLVAFQILSHPAIRLPLILVSKLPEDNSILLVRPFIFLRFPIAIVAGLFLFLDQTLQIELGSNRGLTAAVRLSNHKNAVEGRDFPNCGWLCRCQKPHVVNRGSPAV
jgi:hypothetical protein